MAPKQTPMFGDKNTDDQPIVLLDLNFTLVGNSRLKSQQHKQKMPFRDQIKAERYRAPLIDILKPYRILLCTVRPDWHESRTLAHIASQLGWQPYESFFRAKDQNWQGFIAKKEYLLDSIFPAHGQPDDVQYVAIESSKKTRAMFENFHIPCATAEQVIKHGSLDFLLK